MQQLLQTRLQETWKLNTLTRAQCPCVLCSHVSLWTVIRCGRVNNACLQQETIMNTRSHLGSSVWLQERAVTECGCPRWSRLFVLWVSVHVLVSLSVPHKQTFLSPYNGTYPQSHPFSDAGSLTGSSGDGVPLLSRGRLQRGRSWSVHLGHIFRCHRWPGAQCKHSFRSQCL